MNKQFERIILEDIDSFNFLDPNCFKKETKRSKKESKKECDKKRPECKNDSELTKAEAEDKEFEPVFKNAKNAVDLRRYLQYSNAGNE